MITSSFWLGRRVFVTGHTGFKGSWLALMLSRLNARTTGFALAPPTRPSLFDLARVDRHIDDRRGDVRDLDALATAMRDAAPEIVIHMAAQPLVRRSYAAPVETYATNVMGTVNVLEAARRVDSVRMVLVVTTDKCYENRDWVWGYRETDALGGRDPYSNSKACAELVTAAWRDSFFGASGQARVVSARAGNVIGGGDFAVDRIIPDALRAFMAGRPLAVRNPAAVRPWQHVLEPLAGYLLLVEKAMTAAPERACFDGGFNFGPGPDSERSVEELLTHFIADWGKAAQWSRDGASHPHEARLLRLDTAKAHALLQWSPLLSFAETTRWTAQWYRAFVERNDIDATTFGQIDAYLGQRVRLTSPLSIEGFAVPGDAAPIDGVSPGTTPKAAAP